MNEQAVVGVYSMNNLQKNYKVITHDLGSYNNCLFW